MSSLTEHYSNPANRVCQHLYFTGEAAGAEKGHINYSKNAVKGTPKSQPQVHDTPMSFFPDGLFGQKGRTFF